MIRRHDAVVDKLCEWLDKIHINYRKEERYHKPLMGCAPMRIKDRPGDIFIEHFGYSECKSDSVYIDVTVGNIFADKYISHTREKRAWLAEDMENRKERKYHNNYEIVGAGLEVLGGMSKSLRALIDHIANVLDTQTVYPAAIWKNQIRSQVLTTMMQYNANMIRSCRYVIDL